MAKHFQTFGPIIALLGACASSAQVLPSCSWPLVTTGTGITNVAYPDTNATYWTMPFDSVRWKSIVITGTYPQSRFFSYVAYVANGSVADNGSLNDVDINPDAGSINPFRTTPVSGEPQDYTITAGRKAPSSGETNFLQLGDTRLAWIIYRIYVPNEGLQRTAGVPLPAVTVVGHDGKSHTVPPCQSSNDSTMIANLVRTLTSQGLDADLTFLKKEIASANPSATEKVSCQPEPLVSWIPKNTGGYFPNPANKYITIPGLCFEPDRIVVVRGKGAVFPDTYHGSPIWEPPGIELRYWSMCNNDQHAPYPVVACQADHSTSLDDAGYYTYVMSEPEQTQPPSWLPPYATWLPWGSRIVANVLIFRNMLPAASFQNSVQAAIQAGCVVNNQQGSPPARDEIVKEGACAQQVMQQYYPKAVYCNKQVFINEGWEGCFAAAESGSN
jgi:hypothetical protein